MQIIRLPVKSSQVVSIGYSPGTLELDVEFKSYDPKKGPSIYRYRNVSATDYAGIIGAESIGKAINATLKKNPTKHPFVKLPPEEAAK